MCAWRRFQFPRLKLEVAGLAKRVPALDVELVSEGAILVVAALGHIGLAGHNRGPARDALVALACLRSCRGVKVGSHCSSRVPPNNAFKPNPLRGSA